MAKLSNLRRWWREQQWDLKDYRDEVRRAGVEPAVSPIDIYDMAELVAKRLGTDVTPSRYRYKDDLIEVTKWMASLEVWMIDPTEKVFDVTDYLRPKVDMYRPGLWVGHLQRLHDRARGVDEPDWRRQRMSNKFSPIDDSDGQDV